MYIPRDVVDLIIDQLSLSADDTKDRDLHAASLVATAWVDRCQHHLFSTVEFDDTRKIRRWCSRIKPDPCGVSRHVCILVVGCRRSSLLAREYMPLGVSDVEPALPHLTSFKNLREFILGYAWLWDTPFVFAAIFSSSAATLKRLRWAEWRVNESDTWEDIRAFANLLPNLAYVDFSGYLDEYKGVEIRLSADEGSTLAVKRFKFHELRIINVVPLSLPFFGSCGPHLRLLDLDPFGMLEPSERESSLIAISG